MRMFLLIGLFLLNSFSNMHGSLFRNYFDQHYPLKFVSNIPAGTTNRIFIISTRNIHTEKDLKITKGVHPRYKIFLFIAGICNDTAYVSRVESYEKTHTFLPESRDFLVYVDGYGKTFSLTMERGFELTKRFNLNVVVFDWPTDYLALRKSIYNATEVSASFVKSMRSLNEVHERFFPTSTFSVIFHSMGNRILKEVSNPKLLDKMPRMLFSNIIINAAAVKSGQHVKWVERLNIQKRIYITMNDQDFNLRGASIMRLSEQLGMGNKNKRARNAFYVDFSEIATIEHNLFLGRSELEQSNPNIFHFYDMAFHGREVRFDKVTGLQIFSPSEESFLFSVR